MNYQEFIELAKKKGITNIQITIETSICNEIYFINDNLDDYSDASKVSYKIKCEYNDKVVQTTTEYLNEEIINILIEKSQLIDTSYKDKFLEEKETESIVHSKEVTTSEEIAKIKELYMLKKQYPLIKSIEFAYSDNYEETTIVNNKGLNITTSSHSYKFVVEAIAKKGKESSSADRSILVTDKKEFNFEDIVIDVLEKATQQVTKEKLETKKYNVVLDSSVVSSVLSVLKNMLSAQSIRKKTSCLTGQINNKLFSEKLTIVEEPLNSNYPGYTIFDKEGTDTYNKIIIENGVLKTYLYDIKESKIENIESTGNNYGQISTRNMYIKPSDKNVKELLKLMNDGIYIIDMMGASGTSINESTGNISIQVFGYIIKNGKIMSGFHPAVMSTTIYELLSNIEEIGNDVTYRRKDIGSPSLYIKNISVASE